MRNFKVVSDGYILCIGRGDIGSEISDNEYNDIVAAIKDKPTTTEETGYKLREDLTWESYTIAPPPPPDAEELTPNEALDILTGVGE